MWNLHWTGVRLPSPPLMKIKVILISFLLLLNGINIVKSNEAFRFLTDGRPKHIMYWNVSYRLIHIDIECKKPRIILNKEGFDKSSICYDNINIFFFPTDFTLIHTLGWRYVQLKET